jgi:hypothetical protein
LKRVVLSLAAMAAIAAACVGAASPVAAGGTRATATHYTASYACPCVGEIQMTGVHITNAQFAGLDSGEGSAIGGRDNFSGTVSDPPAQQLVLTGGNPSDPTTAWCSDYDGQASYDWQWVINPDGTEYGWAVYPDANSPCPIS